MFQYGENSEDCKILEDTLDRVIRKKKGFLAGKIIFAYGLKIIFLREI